MRQATENTVHMCMGFKSLEPFIFKKEGIKVKIKHVIILCSVLLLHPTVNTAGCTIIFSRDNKDINPRERAGRKATDSTET